MAEYYKISGETLTAIADRTRGLANTTDKLTPEDIIYWLGRVTVLPRGHAESAFLLNFESSAVGELTE